MSDLRSERVVDPLARLGAGVDALAAEDRQGWSNAARSAHLVELLERRDRLEAEVLRALGEWDAAGACADEGVLHPVGWLATHAAMTRRDASDLLRAARLAYDHPRTAKALAAGDVSAANVKLLARATRHRDVVFDEHEDSLLDAATELAPEQFRRLARRWQTLADDHLDRTPAALQIDRWHLNVSTTFGGAVALSGLLDPEGGAIVLAALDALDTPDPTDGVRVRSLPQRRADALIALAQGTGGPRRVNLDVLVDVGRLRGESPTDLESFRRELVGIGPITQATLECLACDSNVGRIVMRGKSLVLDLGRRTPVVSAAQHRALAVRDGGCIEPGCSAPPGWCDAHHLDHWIRGGPTDLDNLELRCRRHHLQVHGGNRGARPPPWRDN
jgi:hypothetical protein